MNIWSTVVLIWATGFFPVAQGQPARHQQCRFAPLYSTSDLLSNASSFLDDVFYWEGQFHSTQVAYNVQNGMTYDGCLLDLTTGVANLSERHEFSAPSKESLQIMVYAHAIAGNSLAASWVYPQNPPDAPEWAAAVLNTKLRTYLTFNESYPGFGGFLPWFLANETDIRPTSDWVDRVPALDNGELIWAVYALVNVLHQSNRTEFRQLGDSWEQWLNYTKTTAARIFYVGDGRVCAVANLNQSVDPFSSSQNYTCEKGSPAYLDDPYEGELFTWWLYFFGNLSDTDQTALWDFKRPQLRAMNYTGSIVNTTFNDHAMTNYSGLPVQPPKIGPITVQEGYYFSSHEQWKVLEMPYLDVDLVKRVYHNAERVRTCNSLLMGQNAGMFASVNDITDPTTDQIETYISAAGIPSVASQQDQELDVVTPYSVFPTVLFNQSVGLAWYRNMLDAHGMQNPYGSTESLRRDGTGISSFVSWDSKVTTIVALLGGVGTTFVRAQMELDGIYDVFVNVTNYEYGMVFSNGRGLAGEDVDMCLPDFVVPVGNVTDFASCMNMNGSSHGRERW